MASTSTSPSPSPSSSTTASLGLPEVLQKAESLLSAGSTNVEEIDAVISQLRQPKLIFAGYEVSLLEKREKVLQQLVNQKIKSQTPPPPASPSTATIPPYTHDLTHQIGGYLDRHLVFPLLEFLQNHEVYPKEEIIQGKLDLLAKTNMVDFAIDIYKDLHKVDEDPAEMIEQRNQVLSKLSQLDAQAEPLLKVLSEEVDGVSLLAQLESQNLFNMDHLSVTYGVTADALQAFYRFARFKYDCGFYSEAADYLKHFRRLNTDPDLNYSALWGELAAEILSQQWDAALEDLYALRDCIESRPYASQADLLQQRVWLMHWSLFVFFNHPNGRNGISELFFKEKYLNAIQVACPHLLRYLATAVIANKRWRGVLNELISVLKAEHFNYSDPVTEFLECLYVDFDFDRAQQKLSECETVLNNDFFLVACRAEFVETARLFIFETYCRIHSCIDLTMLSQKLGMDESLAERWIVNLIRNAKIDAKIDSAANQVIMGNPSIPIYQRIIDNTKDLCLRTHGSFQSLTSPHQIANSNALNYS